MNKHRGQRQLSQTQKDAQLAITIILLILIFGGLLFVKVTNTMRNISEDSLDSPSKPTCSSSAEDYPDPCDIEWSIYWMEQ